jgi:hypothetical protein
MSDYGLAEDHNFDAGFDFELRDYDESRPFDIDRWRPPQPFDEHDCPRQIEQCFRKAGKNYIEETRYKK